MNADNCCSIADYKLDTCKIKYLRSIARWCCE